MKAVIDLSPRTSALKLAKTIIGTHGLTAYMTKYNSGILSRDVTDATSALRCEFHLDPSVSGWSPDNPSVVLTVAYEALKDKRQNDACDTVVDHRRRVVVMTSATEMNTEIFKKRESMLSMTMMLCELLESSLPAIVTSVEETASMREDRLQRAAEQIVGEAIYKSIDRSSFLGLRRGGSSREVFLGESYLKAAESYPRPGAYRFKHVRRTDTRGRAKDVAYYTLHVQDQRVSTAPPVVTIRRVDGP